MYKSNSVFLLLLLCSVACGCDVWPMFAAAFRLCSRHVSCLWRKPCFPICCEMKGGVGGWGWGGGGAGSVVD